MIKIENNFLIENESEGENEKEETIEPETPETNQCQEEIKKIKEQISELTQKVEKQETNENKNAQKIQKLEEEIKTNKNQISEQKQEITTIKDKIQDNAAQNNTKFEELQENIKSLLNKINNHEEEIKLLKEEKWVNGEYKWMPIGSSMPKGWIKINIAKGWTLVQGDNEKEKETSGITKKHSHNFGNNREAASLYKQSTVWFYNASSGPKDYVIATKRIHDVIFPLQTSQSGKNLAENNLAAGLFAELWQYRK